MLTKDYSQAGQTQWAFDRLVGSRAPVPSSRTFLDIGANHPVQINNTIGLELLGWRGILIDNDSYCVDLCRQHRKSPVYEADSTKFDYAALPIKDFDYLSLDVDAATLDTLRKVMADGITFRCATIEHDLYRFGPGPRDAMRDLLERAGYCVDKADVSHPGSPNCPYEDWWIDPKRI